MTSKDKIFYALAAAFASAVTYAIFTIFLWTPTAQVTAGGLAQKILYFYAGVSMGIYVTGGACFLASAIYLVRPSETANAWARAGSDCAALFGTLVLCSGPFWHKKAGGAYWLWDLQLTTTVLSDLVYWAICLLRAFAGEGAVERRFAAALGIMGTINLPIIYYSVQNWGGNHPPVIREGGGMDPSMKPALLWGAISMTVLLPSLLLWLRSRLHLLQASLEHTRQEALARGLVEGSDDLEPLEEALPMSACSRGRRHPGVPQAPGRCCRDGVWRLRSGSELFSAARNVELTCHRSSMIRRANCGVRRNSNALVASNRPRAANRPVTAKSAPYATQLVCISGRNYLAQCSVEVFATGANASIYDDRSGFNVVRGNIFKGKRAGVNIAKKGDSGAALYVPIGFGEAAIVGMHIAGLNVAPYDQSWFHSVLDIETQLGVTVAY